MRAPPGRRGGGAEGRRGSGAGQRPAPTRNGSHKKRAPRERGLRGGIRRPAPIGADLQAKHRPMGGLRQAVRPCRPLSLTGPARVRMRALRRGSRQALTPGNALFMGLCAHHTTHGAMQWALWTHMHSVTTSTRGATRERPPAQPPQRPTSPAGAGSCVDPAPAGTAAGAARPVREARARPRPTLDWGSGCPSRSARSRANADAAPHCPGWPH